MFFKVTLPHFYIQLFYFFKEKKEGEKEREKKQKQMQKKINILIIKKISSDLHIFSYLFFPLKICYLDLVTLHFGNETIQD